MGNAGNPYKHYVFAGFRRFSFTCLSGAFFVNGAQIPRGAIKGSKKQ